MRLTDLSPRWIGLNGEDWCMPGVRLRFGLSFSCPCCRNERLAVMFKPFIDPNNLAALVPWAIPGAPDPNTGIVKDVKWWARTGEDFGDLSLAPSINAGDHGHWHGFITNGEVA